MEKPENKTEKRRNTSPNESSGLNFEGAKETYRKNAVVQKRMAKKLIAEILKTCGGAFDNILEIGAGTGFLTDEITKSIHYKHLFLNDITENFTGHIPYKYLKGDIISTILEENAFDLMLSGAAIQWVNDREKLFYKLNKSLKTGGILAFSAFGKENFSQIKDITGFSLNYDFPEKIFKEAGFCVLYFEEELETLYFEGIEDILKHIKLTGVGASKGLWTKNKYETFKNEYLKRYKDGNGFELTYHPVYFILKKV